MKLGHVGAPHGEKAVWEEENVGGFLPAPLGATNFPPRAVTNLVVQQISDYAWTDEVPDGPKPEEVDPETGFLKATPDRARLISPPGWHSVFPTGPGRIVLDGPFRDGSWFLSFPREQPLRLALPYYEFRWPDPDNTNSSLCQVDVSGITGTVVDFEYKGPGARLRMPANYYEMLGMPADVVFVVPSFTKRGKYEVYEQTYKHLEELEDLLLRSRHTR
jgi:hypothetical protein